ncbi:MAG: ABC transporter ATP-binding protein [Egibacteraceae bacterium]
MTALLDIRDLSVGFRIPRGTVQALSSLSLRIDPGETVVMVGESGSGKTVCAHAIIRLLPRNAWVTGQVWLDGQDLLTLPEADLRAVRGRRIALIPQSPGTALNPVRRLDRQLLEAASLRGLDRHTARRRLGELLDAVGLGWEAVAARYPHQLSGGMQQRVVNALAMVSQPDLVIADEPTDGLDADLVDITAQQLRDITAQGAALLVITHDLRLAQQLGGRLALLYASQLVEVRDSAAFFAAPAHPYGRGLLGALPERGGIPIPGLSPQLTDLPAGCAFAPRCAWRRPGCAHPPPVVELDDGLVRCLLHA